MKKDKDKDKRTHENR